tara:strand:- start:674 stop:1543 length:870 start_codon:yes stop_codon:yes gene_type:complete
MSFKKKIKIYLIILALAFIPYIVSAQVNIGETPQDVVGVVIPTIELPGFNNDTGAVNSSQFTDIWKTAQGDMDNVPDLYPTLDGRYVEVTGDVMTDGLGITNSGMNKVLLEVNDTAHGVQFIPNYWGVFNTMFFTGSRTGAIGKATEFFLFNGLGTITWSGLLTGSNFYSTYIETPTLNVTTIAHIPHPITEETDSFEFSTNFTNGYGVPIRVYGSFIHNFESGDDSLAKIYVGATEVERVGYEGVEYMTESVNLAFTFAVPVGETWAIYPQISGGGTLAMFKIWSTYE